MRCSLLFTTVWALLNESSQAKDHQPAKWSGGLWGRSIAHKVQQEFKKIKAHQVAPRSCLAFVSTPHRRNGKPNLVTRATEADDDYVEIFRDDFDTLDRNVWNFDFGLGPKLDGWGNWEKQFYTNSPRNAFVKDSALNVKIIKEHVPMENPPDFNYTSARLTTKGTFNFTFGRVDTRVRLKEHPTGPFSAIWALSDKMIEQDDWPLCGEIDFFEYQAIWNFTPSTLHFKAHSAGNALSYEAPLLAENKWHDISMEWTPDYIAFVQNGEEVGRYSRPKNPTMTDWPYNADNSMHLIINNAMMPSWSDYMPPSEDFKDHTLEIDYISVSQKRKYL